MRQGHAYWRNGLHGLARSTGRRWSLCVGEFAHTCVLRACVEHFDQRVGPPNFEHFLNALKVMCVFRMLLARLSLIYIAIVFEAQEPMFRFVVQKYMELLSREIINIHAAKVEPILSRATCWFENRMVKQDNYVDCMKLSGTQGHGYCKSSRNWGPCPVLCKSLLTYKTGPCLVEEWFTWSSKKSWP